MMVMPWLWQNFRRRHKYGRYCYFYAVSQKTSQCCGGH